MHTKRRNHKSTKGFSLPHTAKKKKSVFSLFYCNFCILSCLVLNKKKISLLYIRSTIRYTLLSKMWVLWDQSIQCKCNRANALRISKIYTKSAAVSGSEKGRFIRLFVPLDSLQSDLLIERSVYKDDYQTYYRER